MTQSVDLLARFGLEPFQSRQIVVGKAYGRLTVLAVGRLKPRKFYAVCECACGSGLRRTRADGLANGTITSCGCARREVTTRHGLWRHPLYNTWRNMVRRCEDPRNKRYQDYGGRGIAVCERWRNLPAFVEDMAPSWEPGLEIDRLDNDGPYSPDNCRWATHAEQARRKRNLRYVTIGGATKTAAEWARENGVNYSTALSRIRTGWDSVEAVTSREDARRYPRA